MSTPDQSVSADSQWALLASAEPSAASIGTVLEAREDNIAGADLVSLIVASEKALSLLQARQATLLAEFARPGRAGDVSALVAAYTEGFDPLTRRPDGEIDTDVLQFVIDEQSHKLAAAEVAAALHVSPITARRRVTAAVELTAELSGTHAALAAGRIDRARAWVIVDRTAVLDRETRGLVEDRILPIAADRTPGRLRELVDRAVIAVDPRPRRTAGVRPAPTVESSTSRCPMAWVGCRRSCPRTGRCRCSRSLICWPEPPPAWTSAASTPAAPTRSPTSPTRCSPTGTATSPA